MVKATDTTKPNTKAKAKAKPKAKPRAKTKDGEVEDKVKVQDIIIDRLIAKIEADGKLPWQRPFSSSCMNWFSNTEYKGINKILLAGGEYITPNQLKQYNEKNDTSFWWTKGDPYEIVVFYSKTKKKITDKEAQDIIAKGYAYSIRQDDNGNWYKESWVLRYYKVYSLGYIKDKDGNTLPSKLGNTVIETVESADEVVEKYTSKTGVTVTHGQGSGAYYTEQGDRVSMQSKETFKSTEAYYRVLFHELIHSTGVEKRLNRSCFKDYHVQRSERSKEELIAEIGGLLLASECGFRDDTEWAENSLTYVAGWCSWMKANPKEVVQGMFAAEKAKSYILSGGVVADESGTVSIDTGKSMEMSQ